MVTVGKVWLWVASGSKTLLPIITSALGSEVNGYGSDVTADSTVFKVGGGPKGRCVGER